MFKNSQRAIAGLDPAIHPETPLKMRIASRAAPQHGYAVKPAYDE
jgi:hypothetical protein